jgi:hypothetical protein
MMPQTRTMVRRPPMLRGETPRFQVFDRRERPPMTVGRFYRDPDLDAVVFEVYEDRFREFLKRAPGLRGKRYAWQLDVGQDAPGDTISEIVVPEPMPASEIRGGGDGSHLTLPEAVDAIGSEPFYRVLRTSDPV